MARQAIQIDKIELVKVINSLEESRVFSNRGELWKAIEETDFALIQCAWEYQNEKVVEHFKSNIELFRKTVEMAAGHCDLICSIERKEWIETPKSIAFDAMSESEFQDLYDNVLSVLFRIFLKHVTEEEFKRNLQYF